MQNNPHRIVLIGLCRNVFNDVAKLVVEIRILGRNMILCHNITPMLFYTLRALRIGFSFKMLRKAYKMVHITVEYGRIVP